MCFSASASFSSSAILAVAGTLLALRVKSKKLLPLAMIPLFFALQQFAEGIVWLWLPEESFAKNIFLFFAYVFWPIWFPYAFWFSEETKLRKQLLVLCLGVGIVLGVFLMMRIPDTGVIFYQHSIHYSRKDNSNSVVLNSAFTFYGISTLLPWFLSSLRWIWLLGILIITSGIIILLIDQMFFISMWCFLAALITLGLYLVLKQQRGRA